MLSGLDRRCAVLEAPRLDRGALVYSAAALTSLFGDLNNDDLYEDDKQEPPVDAPTLTITEPMPSSLTVHNLFPTPPSFTITVGPEIFNDAPSSGVTPLSSIPASTPVQTSSPIPTQDLGLSISTAPVPNDAPTSSPPPAILPTSTTTSSQGPLSSIAQVTFSPPPLLLAFLFLCHILCCLLCHPPTPQHQLLRQHECISLPFKSLSSCKESWSCSFVKE